MNNNFWRSSLFKTGIIIALAFIVAEMLMQIRASIRYGDSHSSMYLEHPKLGQILKPNFKSDGTLGKVRINSKGFRGEEFSDKHGENVVRIICVGSSVVFGGTINDELLFTAVLQNLLNNKLSKSGKSVDVINAGVAGWSSEKVLWNIENRLINYSPNIILIYPVANDIGVIMRKKNGNNLGGDNSYFSLKLFLKEYSVLYNVFRDFIKPVLPQTIGAQFNNFPENSVNIFYESYKKIVLVCRNHGMVPVLLTESYAFRHNQSREEQLDLLKGEGWGLGLDGSFEAHETLNQAIKKLAKRENVDLIDVFEMMEGGSSNFIDAIHFSKIGHKIIAQILTEKILAVNLINRVTFKDN